MCSPDGCSIVVRYEMPCTWLPYYDTIGVMKPQRLSSDRVDETFLARLLLEALKEVSLAYARTNKTAALFTLAAIERDLIARAEAFPGLLASPPMPRATTDRMVMRIAAALGDIQRAAEDVSVQ
jgi:hypothetical protein